jgi:hypothetical protein
MFVILLILWVIYDNSRKTHPKPSQYSQSQIHANLISSQSQSPSPFTDPHLPPSQFQSQIRVLGFFNRKSHIPQFQHLTHAIVPQSWECKGFSKYQFVTSHFLSISSHNCNSWNLISTPEIEFQLFELQSQSQLESSLLNSIATKLNFNSWIHIHNHNSTITIAVGTFVWFIEIILKLLMLIHWNTRMICVITIARHICMVLSYWTD